LKCVPIALFIGPFKKIMALMQRAFFIETFLSFICKVMVLLGLTSESL
jgi:hypothetical protein